MNPFSDSLSAATAGASLDRPIAPHRPLADSQADFASIIGRGRGAELSPEERARQGAEQLVAVSLVQPILQQMRHSPWAAAPFAPNQAERTFRGMLDAQLAQRLVSQGRWPLVDAVARRVLRQDQPTAAEPRHPTG